MKNETLIVAFSNQKGGVGKSTMATLLASYLHYTKGLNIAVVDCDSPQHSLASMRERDKDAVMNSPHFKQLMMAQFKRIGKKAYNRRPDGYAEQFGVLYDGARLHKGQTGHSAEKHHFLLEQNEEKYLDRGVRCLLQNPGATGVDSNENRNSRHRAL